MALQVRRVAGNVFWRDALRSRPLAPRTRPRRSMALQAEDTATTERGPPGSARGRQCVLEGRAPSRPIAQGTRPRRSAALQVARKDASKKRACSAIRDCLTTENAVPCPIGTKVRLAWQLVQATSSLEIGRCRPIGVSVSIHRPMPPHELLFISHNEAARCLPWALATSRASELQCLPGTVTPEQRTMA